MVSPFPIPLNAIRAIEIVARLGALGPAAEELGVTPGAVSQHIRRAEERLGLDLFERTPRGLKPTPVLRQILPQLSAGFGTLADAVAGLKGSDERVLTVTVGSVFASRWLIWRVAKFGAVHPDIELRLVVTAQMVDFRHSDIDCGIRFGRGPWPGVVAERIMPGDYSPVAAPVVAARLKSAADVATVPVIHDTSSMLPWDAWYRAAGLAARETQGPVYGDPALAFDAAISGQGVLMAVEQMSADAVSDGRLVRVPGPTVATDLGYWLVRADGRREPRKVKMFREWLRIEVPESSKGYLNQLRETPK